MMKAFILLQETDSPYIPNWPNLIFLLIIVSVLYFLPTIIGFKKKNATAIFILNLFLGWTFIGWVVALVWSFTKD
ncbi:MAG TPA: superinfection immunity protein [Hanamia sp.]